MAGNRQVCLEHYRLTLRVDSLPDAAPGQFVHIGREREVPPSSREVAPRLGSVGSGWVGPSGSPLLRRAFSIAGFDRTSNGVLFDVIYRVVGTATRWMRSLSPGDLVSVLGPRGNSFPIHPKKPRAWLVAGGVGLPPMLWLAEALHEAGKRSIAFCGAQRADLLALTVNPAAPPALDAARATSTAAEFARHDVKVVLSTDDGSLGFHGHIGAAMAAYHEKNPTPPDELVIYTCGPEGMIRFVADYGVTRGIECYACMERTMACGIGTCQSCVVPVNDERDPDGWRYELCCTDGPVFDAKRIAWETRGDATRKRNLQ